MSGVQKFNHEVTTELAGLIPEWDGTMPQGQMCQRPDGLVRDNLGTCRNEAKVGIPYARWDKTALENDSDTPSSIEFHYLCEECATECEAEDEMIGSYFEACEERFPEFVPCIIEPHISRLMNEEVTIDELVLEQYADLVGDGVEAPCLDCGNGVWGDRGVDPRWLPEQHKFTGYVLKDSVWEETGLRRTGNPMFGVPPQILCIECAQVRIGRELTLDDFKVQAMNFQSNGVIDYLFPGQNDRREWADEEIRLAFEPGES